MSVPKASFSGVRFGWIRNPIPNISNFEHWILLCFCITARLWKLGMVIPVFYEVKIVLVNSLPSSSVLLIRMAHRVVCSVVSSSTVVYAMLVAGHGCRIEFLVHSP